MLLRFLDAVVFANLDQMKSWSQLKRTTIQNALNALMESEAIVKIEVDGLGEGFMQKKDLHLTNEEIPQSVFMLDNSDFLVRTETDELKEKFKGAVLGHWRIGPHDIEDITLYLGEEEPETRKEEIISAVRTGYSVETTHILRFNGENL